MASGFIHLSDGSMWSRRWSAYDFTLETVMLELSDREDEGELKAWLKHILPDESAGDSEGGYCFFKANGETVLRILDMRLMKEKYARIFWEKVAELAGELTGDEAPGWFIHELRAAYIESLRHPAQPSDADDTLRRIFYLGGHAMAEGDPPSDDDETAS